MKLFHGTHHSNLESILTEGLKGGDNLSGGNKGAWNHPRLFLTPDLHVASQYGDVVVVVDVDESNGTWIIDGVGDKCFVVEGETWDDILVSDLDVREYICCEEDTCLPHCECDCSRCEVNWRIR